MEPAIRRATENDVEALLDLRLALLRENAPATPDPSVVSELVSANRQYFRRALDDGSFKSWVAEVDSHLVACSGLVLFTRPPTPRQPRGVEGYVMNMYTVPSWRRRGLATSLLEACLEDARCAGAGVVWLRTTEAGRRLYSRYGFTSVEDVMVLRL